MMGVRSVFEYRTDVASFNIQFERLPSTCSKEINAGFSQVG